MSSWKLLLALALALAWLPASSARAQDEPGDEEVTEQSDEPAEKSAEPATEEPGHACPNLQALLAPVTAPSGFAPGARKMPWS